MTFTFNFSTSSSPTAPPPEPKPIPNPSWIHPERITLQFRTASAVLSEQLQSGTTLHRVQVSEQTRLQQSEWQDPRLVQAEEDGTDVAPGVYEGGFKLWECALHLSNYLEREVPSWEGQRVLELGCGHGLPAMVALQRGASLAVFQDLNRDVLLSSTMVNLHLNHLQNENVHFVSGDWRCSDEMVIALIPELSFPSKSHSIPDSLKFDAIFTSDTLYSEASLPALITLFSRLLKPGSKAFIAAKRYYFGVGGGIAALQPLLEAHSNTLRCHGIVHSISDGQSNVRDIFVLERR